MSRQTGKAHVIFESLGEWTSGNEQCRQDNEDSDFGIPLKNFHVSGATKIQYSYPVKIMIPQYSSSSMCQWVYFMSYGGGLVEGDHLQLQLDVGEHCCAVLTSQASTKVYCCDEGKVTRQDISCTVGSGAMLAIIPHTVIPFKNARYIQTQKVSMCVDSNLVLLDWMTAGRIARGEIWEFDGITMSNHVEVDGDVVLKEAICLEDSPYQSVAKAMAKYQVTGSLLLLGPLLQPLVKKLLAVIGKHKNYDDTYDCSSLTSISELKYSVKAGMIQGCLIRFVGKTTTEVQKLLNYLLKPLYPVLGGDPLNK